MISYDFVPISSQKGVLFLRHPVLLGHFLCDRVQSVERFAAHPRHFPSQVPPSGHTRK